MRNFIQFNFKISFHKKYILVTAVQETFTEQHLNVASLGP